MARSASALLLPRLLPAARYHGARLALRRCNSVVAVCRNFNARHGTWRASTRDLARCHSTTRWSRSTRKGILKTAVASWIAPLFHIQIKSLKIVEGNCKEFQYLSSPAKSLTGNSKYEVDTRCRLFSSSLKEETSIELFMEGGTESIVSIEFAAMPPLTCSTLVEKTRARAKLGDDEASAQPNLSFEISHDCAALQRTVDLTVPHTRCKARRSIESRGKRPGLKFLSEEKDVERFAKKHF